MLLVLVPERVPGSKDNHNWLLEIYEFKNPKP